MRASTAYCAEYRSVRGSSDEVMSISIFPTARSRVKKLRNNALNSITIRNWAR